MVFVNPSRYLVVNSQIARNNASAIKYDHKRLVSTTSTIYKLCSTSYFILVCLVVHIRCVLLF